MHKRCWWNDVRRGAGLLWTSALKKYATKDNLSHTHLFKWLLLWFVVFLIQTIHRFIICKLEFTYLSLLCTACTKYKEMLIWQHLYYQIILIYIFIQYYTCITEITALYRTIYFVKSDKPKQKMYTVKSHSSACLDHTEVSVI